MSNYGGGGAPHAPQPDPSLKFCSATCKKKDVTFKDGGMINKHAGIRPYMRPVKTGLPYRFPFYRSTVVVGH